MQMHEIPKHLKRPLREWAGIAHERELGLFAEGTHCDVREVGEDPVHA
jgi:hypothetical protein